MNEATIEIFEKLPTAGVEPTTLAIQASALPTELCRHSANTSQLESPHITFQINLTVSKV